jgi:hypothetical protein
MALETVTNIDDLVVTNPLSTDARSQGDDHIRNIKLALKTDLPNITGVMTATQAELNVNTGVTGGTVTASKTVVVDASSKVDVWNVDNLVFNGNDISSTSADIDLSPTTNVTMPSDTAKFVMGAGDDASLNFDGTNLIILTDGAGASGIILDSEDDTFELKGSGVLQATFDTAGLNLVTGDAYYIAGTSVLNATTLGTAVVTSSLTTVGALGSGSISSGFGAIDNGASAITTTGTITGGVVVADNININGNTIISTDTAGDINITPDTTGDIVLDGVKWPQADGTANQFLQTDGAGQSSWFTGTPAVGVVTETGTQTLTNKTITALKVGVNAGVTASSGSIQGGEPITVTYTEIATCATAGDSVTLPTAAAGLVVVVANNGAESADVFPASGDDIDKGGVNTAYALASGTNTIFICQDTLDWDTISGGGGAINVTVDTMTGDAADTTLTLSQTPGSENQVSVSLDGVTQDHSTYSVSGTTLTFSTAPPLGVSVEAVTYGGALDVGTPSDNTVDETKLKDALIADFTEVVVTASDSILLGDATDSGNTKRDTVQGLLDLVPAGGWAFVSSATAATSALLSFTNMVDGYDYEYVVENMKSASDAVHLVAQLGIAGPTYRTSGYLSSSTTVNNSAAPQALVATAHMLLSCTETMGTTGSEELWRATMTLTNPAGTTNKTGYMGTMSVYGASPQNVPGLFGGAYNTAAEAHTSIKFFMDSGNIASGEIYQYRRARS